MSWIDMVVQAGVGQIGSLVKHRAQKEALERNARRSERELERNADLAQGAAAEARRQGALQAGAVRSEGVKLGAEQQVLAAVSGAAQGGSLERTIDGTSQLADIDAQIVETNAARAAWGFERKATLLREQSAELRKETDETSTALDWGLLFDMVTGGSQAIGAGINAGASNSKSTGSSDGGMNSESRDALASGELMSTNPSFGGGGSGGGGGGSGSGDWVGYDQRNLYEYDLSGRPRIKRGG